MRVTLHGSAQLFLHEEDFGLQRQGFGSKILELKEVIVAMDF